MFRSFFGTKSDRPTPPKNQIEVVCPACGAAQYEPRLVVSTFCKKCGVHLTIHRKQVTASTVTRSGIGASDSRRNGNSATNGTAHPAPAPVAAPIPPPAPAPAPRPAATKEDLPPELLEPITPEEAAEGGFGAFLKQQSVAAAAPAPAQSVARETPPPPPPETSPAASAPVVEEPAPPKAPVPARPPSVLKTLTSRPPPPAVVSEKAPEPKTEPKPDTVADAAEDNSADAEPPVIIEELAPPAAQSATSAAPAPPAEETPSFSSRRPQSHSPAPTQAPAPMSASTLQKMKDQGMYRNQYFKDAECFECQHKFKVSRSSRSANCPACGAAIAMEDVEINMPSTQPVKTRGDVLIRKRGIISTDSVRCKDLRCYGTLEANVDATGDAIFRTVGTVVGTVRCKRLVIEKGADVTFLNIAYADEVDIQARVTGSLVASGLLLIGAHGVANGDVTARSVSIEPGGELNGAMNIVRGTAKPKPAVEDEESAESSTAG